MGCRCDVMPASIDECKKMDGWHFVDCLPALGHCCCRFSSSKTVSVQSAPASAPTTSPTVPAPLQTAVIVPQPATGLTAAPATQPADDDTTAMITEDSPNADAVDMQRPPTPDLTLGGTAVKVGSRASQLRALAAETRDDDIDNIDGDEDAATPRESSATSRDSGAVVQERPSSRGGMAYDMTFAGQQARAQLPARLSQLQQRSKREDLTVDELKKKLEAAELRRTSYEQALKDKMAKVWLPWRRVVMTLLTATAGGQQGAGRAGQA